ncbi:MAG: hypothetical protein RSA66_10270 [Muribaculaceae bacterium]
MKATYKIQNVEFEKRTSYLSYTYGGKDYWAQGEFEYDTKTEKFSHTHVTPRGKEIKFNFK